MIYAGWFIDFVGFSWEAMIIMIFIIIEGFSNLKTFTKFKNLACFDNENIIVCIML